MFNGRIIGDSRQLSYFSIWFRPPPTSVTAGLPMHLGCILTDMAARALALRLQTECDLPHDHVEGNVEGNN